MYAEKAKEFYSNHTANCAEAIIKAFAKHFNLDSSLIGKYKNCGSGAAPAGVCGAYFAARDLLQMNCSGKIDEFDKLFVSTAGDLHCPNIRKLKKLSCLGCIKTAADFVEKQIQS